MLSRLEVAYLAALRVVLLIAASVALLVTIGAVIAAAPALGDFAGITGNQPVRGGTLGEFIEANRITDVEQTQEDANESSRLPLPSDVAEASRNFAQYDGRNGGRQLEQSKWDDLFRSVLNEKVPAGQQGDYGSDLLRLSKQLSRSKGKPLSDERLFQLIEYHLDTFITNGQAQQAAKAGRLASSMSKLMLAASAFLVFVLVLFSFLFVKIERNLRGRRFPDESAEFVE